VKYELKVGVSSTPAGGLIPRLRDELGRTLPDVEVRFEVASSAAIRDRVLGRVVELGMVGLHVEHEELRCTPFLEGDRLVVIVPPGSELALAQSVTLRQLAAEPFIGRLRGSGTRATYEPVLAALGHPLSTLRTVREAVSAAASIEAVARGEGTSIVSLLVAREAIEAGRVAALHLETVTLVRNLYLIKHARLTPSEASGRFERFLMDWCSRCHHSAAGLDEAHGIPRAPRRLSPEELGPPV
jgi:DNA-binding transcriptional LysR family regulator